jgi:CpeS-like protein
MLSFQDFFAACSGLWITERTYHYVGQNDIERSHTEFRVNSLNRAEKQLMLSGSSPQQGEYAGVKIDVETAAELSWPGFAIAFDTRSETGEQVAMRLKALFVPDQYVTLPPKFTPLPLPIAAQVAAEAENEIIQGVYLRDEGYSEAGAIAGRFTYQPTRQTLEMTTYYKRSVAVDQMRFLSADVRLRTIVTYQRPEYATPPSQITLVGFGVEHKHA